MQKQLPPLLEERGKKDAADLKTPEEGEVKAELKSKQ